jgi:hypothetical protein
MVEFLICMFELWNYGLSVRSPTKDTGIDISQSVLHFGSDLKHPTPLFNNDLLETNSNVRAVAFSCDTTIVVHNPSTYSLPS